jgi:methionyl-tRNA formyltransferase
MKIVFIGAVQFSASMLEVLIEIKAQIVGVCTLSNAPANADHVDLSDHARRNGIPVLDASDINSVEAVNWIRQLSPDVIFCFGWSRLIKKNLLGAAPLGVVGYHPAALPANRGRHPLIWALALGLNKTASTFFVMDEGADSGDILSQAEVEISPDEDAGTLYQKITEAAKRQLAELVPALAQGRVQRYAQDAAQANSWRKRSAADGRIDWRMPARGIHNLVKALARPYPGAEILTESGPIKVWKVEVVSDVPVNFEPGKVIFYLHDRPVIRCGEQAICLVETEPEFLPAPGVYL